MNGTPPPPISFGRPRAHSPSPLARAFSRRVASAAASSSRASTGSAGTTSSSMKRRTRSRSARTSGVSPYVDMGDPPRYRIPQLDPLARAGGSGSHGHPAAPRCVLDRVVDQLDEHLPEAIDVGLERRAGRVEPRAELDADPLRRL